MSALYGIAPAKGRIELDKTLAELGIDDKPPRLSASEKRATIRFPADTFVLTEPKPDDARCTPPRS